MKRSVHVVSAQWSSIRVPTRLCYAGPSEPRHNTKITRL